MNTAGASDKQARLAIRRSAVIVFAKMRPGETIVLALPKEQPAKRDMYCSLTGAAMSAFGSGQYSIKSKGDNVTIARRLAMRCAICGCTNDDRSDCIARTGKPCHWVANNLCSACAWPVSA